MFGRLPGKKRPKDISIQQVNTATEDMTFSCPVCEFGGEMTIDRRDAAHVIECERCSAVFVIQAKFELHQNVFGIDRPWERLIGKIKENHEGRIFFHFDASKYVNDKSKK
jgi:uncharacterized C2H2 Zn-finger protein